MGSFFFVQNKGVGGRKKENEKKCKITLDKTMRL
mgnify:CR=1 FL=1